MDRMIKRNLEDVGELGVGVWLLVSPFLLGYAANVEATLTAVTVGALLMLTTQLVIARPARWAEYFNLIMAALLIASPFIFGFSSLAAATINSIATGVLLAGFCVIGLVQQRLLERETPLSV